MQYKVTVSTLWHEGKKYRRGDIIDKDYGTSTDLYVEPPKPKRVRKAKPVVEGSDES